MESPLKEQEILDFIDLFSCCYLPHPEVLIMPFLALIANNATSSQDGVTRSVDFVE